MPHSPGPVALSVSQMTMTFSPGTSGKIVTDMPRTVTDAPLLPVEAGSPGATAGPLHPLDPLDPLDPLRWAI